jgi:hypothetical protein
MFKKYAIAGESNPIWQIVEPVVLKIWADGMRKAAYSQLYLIHFMALLQSTVMFLGGFVLRVLLIGFILFLGYAIFEELINDNYHFPSTAIRIPVSIPPNDLILLKTFSDRFYS